MLPSSFASLFQRYGERWDAHSGAALLFDGPAPPSGIVLALLPSLASDIAMWLGVFVALYTLAPLLCAFVPAFNALSRKDQRSYAASFAALPHHVLVVLLAGRTLAAGGFDLAALAGAVPLSLAYLLCDTAWVAIPDALGGDATYLVHHVLGLMITLATLGLNPTVLRLAPHVLLCESSTPFFLTGRVARRAGWPVLKAVSEVAFVVLFFLCRVVNLPLTVASAVMDGTGEGVPQAVHFAMFLLCIMQWYWFRIILQATLCGRQRPGGAAGRKKE